MPAKEEAVAAKSVTDTEKDLPQVRDTMNEVQGKSKDVSHGGKTEDSTEDIPASETINKAQSDAANGSKETHARVGNEGSKEVEGRDGKSSEKKRSRKRGRASNDKRGGRTDSKARKVELKPVDRLEFIESIRETVASAVRKHANEMQEVKSEFLLTRSRPPLFWKPENMTPELREALDKQRKGTKDEAQRRVERCAHNFSNAVRSHQSKPPVTMSKDTTS